MRTLLSLPGYHARIVPVSRWPSDSRGRLARPGGVLRDKALDFLAGTSRTTTSPPFRDHRVIPPLSLPSGRRRQVGDPV
ncbi:hypothetical protein CesoFtcFv8_022530 [Champsocephalus esox]|uniref:Uncharacterized protein n=1 Tax=Champsocephalus esox TaxID=159716 RepID=A0AAN8BB26_9TELE|nr:hypothetical protein CesoFtcFv8_022530 [Champsocephalus esox]